MKFDLLLQFGINGLIIGTLYGMVAMCFVLVFKASRAVNFAQGEFLLVGAWTCWGFMSELQVPFWAGFLLTMVAMTLLGALIQAVVIRPLIGEPVISVIMVTIGLSVVLRGITHRVIFDHAKGGFAAQPIWRLLDGEITPDLMYRPTFKFLKV